jgi:hypothetical protein
MRSVSCDNKTCFLDKMNSEEVGQGIRANDIPYTLPLKSSEFLARKRKNLKTPKTRQTGKGSCTARRKKQPNIQYGLGRKVVSIQKGAGKRRYRRSRPSGFVSKRKRKQRRLNPVQIGKGKKRKTRTRRKTKSVKKQRKTPRSRRRGRNYA